MDIRHTVKPKSDQLNADDLITGPIHVRVESVDVGSGDQPVSIHISKGYKPYKPCMGMLRILGQVWGWESDEWKGHEFVLYREASVKYAGKEVGGIRINAMTGLKSEFITPITIAKGKKQIIRIIPLKPTDDSEDLLSDDQVRQICAVIRECYGIKEGTEEEKAWIERIFRHYDVDSIRSVPAKHFDSIIKKIQLSK